SHSLADLGLSAGTVTLAANESPHRELPKFDSAFERAPGSAAWIVMAADVRLKNIHLPPLDPLACATSGGCFDISATFCLTPCPLPPEPTARDLPASPMLDVDIDCGAWSSTITLGLKNCRPDPNSVQEISCPPDQVNFVGEGCVFIDD